MEGSLSAGAAAAARSSVNSQFCWLFQKVQVQPSSSLLPQEEEYVNAASTCPSHHLPSKRSDHHQSWWQYWNHYHMNQIIPWKLQVAQEHGWSSIILNPSNQCNREWHFTKWFTYNWGRSGDKEKNTYGPAPEEGGLSTTRSRGYWAASAASIR